MVSKNLSILLGATKGGWRAPAGAAGKHLQPRSASPPRVPKPQRPLSAEVSLHVFFSHSTTDVTDPVMSQTTYRPRQWAGLGTLPPPTPQHQASPWSLWLLQMLSNFVTVSFAPTTTTTTPSRLVGVTSAAFHCRSYLL